MTLTTHVERHILAQSRAGLDLVATAAAGGNLAVLWMYTCFHANLRRRRRAKKAGGPKKEGG